MARRLTGADFAAPVVVTGDPFRFIVTEQLAAIEQAPAAILIEPERRNTAPAVLAAALWLAQSDPRALILVTASNHVIPDADAFLALAGDLVTFGINPTRAETGDGYLALAAPAGAEPVPLTRFVKKPAASAAAEMLASRRFLWNAGLFLFSVSSFLAAFRMHVPQMEAAVGAAVSGAQADPAGPCRLGCGAWYFDR